MSAALKRTAEHRAAKVLPMPQGQRVNAYTFRYDCPATSDFAGEWETVEAVTETEARAKAAKVLPWYPLLLVSIAPTAFVTRGGAR